MCKGRRVQNGILSVNLKQFITRQLVQERYSICLKINNSINIMRNNITLIFFFLSKRTTLWVKFTLIFIKL